MASRRCVCLLFLTVTITQLTCGASSEVNKHRAKRLTDVVCDAGTTKIIAPNYYQYNSTGWCGSAVGLLNNDYYNLAYRNECQRWLGGALPDSVAQAQLTYCFEYPNATVVYRIGICCHGIATSLRCFSGEASSSYWWWPGYSDGSANYLLNYGSQLITCQSDEVCQNKYTFYGSNGNVNNVTLTKGCAKSVDCAAANHPTNGTCRSCAVATPACTSCCNTSFCNYDFPYRGVLAPAICPPPSQPNYPCNARPCLNGGICEDTDYISSTAGYANYTCSCRIQWGGKNCTDNRTQCTTTNPCQNGGTCYDYSDVTSGDYRCGCPISYVGDRCELRSNLTCGASNPNYKTYLDRTYYGYNCTQLAWIARGHPEYGVGINYHIQQMCAADGRTAAYRIEFELRSCSRGTRPLYDWTSYHSCCFNRTVCSSSPCLNGGTCYDYSDVTPGDYRCECQTPFIGDKCELHSQLTCNSSDLLSVELPPRNWNEYDVVSANCSAYVNYSRGRPQFTGLYWYNANAVDTTCQWYTSPRADGHRFVQGVDGQISTDKFEFEATYCGRNDRWTFATYRLCCPTCLSSPCQNGGYCQQVTVTEFVCKCTAGYNGKFCENRVSLCNPSGDPHYRTFDGKTFEYQGTCKLNLASPCSSTQQPYFNVFTKNENRPNVSTNVSFPSYVEIVYKNDTVRIYSVAELVGLAAALTVNGLPAQVPYTTPDWYVEYDGLNIRYDTPFGLSVSFDGKWSILVNVPTTLHVGSMCGLCGNNDNNPNNDLTMSNGTFVGNLLNAGNLVGDSYVVSDSTRRDSSKCPAPPLPPPCDPMPSSYANTCGLVNKTSGIFGDCIRKVGQSSAKVFAENCLLDACYTSGKSLCSSIKTFVDLCSSYGASMPCSMWMNAAKCESSSFCPSGMIYQCSAPACQATCADPTAPQFCPFPNKDGCVCPTGQLLHKGQCKSTCPIGCLDLNKQLRPVGDEWSGPNCTTVSCINCSQCSSGANTVSVRRPNCSRCDNNICRNEPQITTKKSIETSVKYGTTTGMSTRTIVTYGMTTESSEETTVTYGMTTESSEETAVNYGMTTETSGFSSLHQQGIGIITTHIHCVLIACLWLI